jgi:RNA polymerase sigma-70 factor (sigma-E family)
MDGVDDSGVELRYVDFVRLRLPGLRRAAYLLCGDWDRGDDIVQKTITELHRKWKVVSKADHLDAVVRSMLFRRFLDERRRRWWQVRLVDEWPDSSGPASMDTADHLDLHAALARLPAKARATVVLRYLYDLSVEQTAAELGCSPGTVKSQTARALAALRRLIETTPETS